MDSMLSKHPGRCTVAPRRTLLSLTLVAAVAVALPASGGPCAVRVGTVAATRAPALQTRLRDLVQSELQALELPAADGRRYLLDVTLDELDTQRAGERTETTCVVSATLRDADDGGLQAILKGRARAGDAAPRAQRARALALSGAVRSALRRVPEAVKR
jgi:hypothetical protein